jgi:signal transduction histidine kinase
MAATTATTPTQGVAGSGGVVGTLVRLAFLVRLLALAFALVGMLVAAQADLLLATLFCVLVLFSHLGLQVPAVRAAVVRHPGLAMPDVVLVSAVPLLVGPDSPLNVVAVSSALLVGVLFPPRTSAPLVLLLVTTNVLAAAPEGGGLWPLSTFTFPVVLVSVAGMGMAFRQVAEEQRRTQADSAAARASAAAAQERLRLARDLHDTVAKSVQGVALTASAIPAWMTRDPAVAQKHAQAVADGAREAVSAARHLLTSLRLDDPERPLECVLDELAVRLEADRGLVVERDLEPVGPLPPAARHDLVMAVVEALENVVRHAPGARTRLTLTDTGDGVEAVVVDDGPGFPDSRREEALDEGRFGLLGLGERMAAAGGTAEVRSAPGFGTQVRLLVPYERDDDTNDAMEQVVR